MGGRGSCRAIAPASPCAVRLGGSLALPISAGFEFFHTFTGTGVGCPGPERPTPEGPQKAEAFCPSQEGIFRRVTLRSKSLKMLAFHLLISHRLPNSLQISDVFDRIELLHISRLDVVKAERGQTIVSKFRVVPYVRKQLGLDRPLLLNHISHFLI